MTILFGARVQDTSWDTAVKEIGPLKVTRLFHSGALPKTYSREGIPAGVRLIISFKDAETNIESYVKSIPSGEDVQLCYHHEPEGDYSSGATFVNEFNTAQDNVRAVNSELRFVFIGGAYQYGASSRHGYSGAFLPPNASRYYLDSYQQGPTLTPAEKDPAVQRFITLLESKGKRFNGFTEYGRGVVDDSHPLNKALEQQRASVFNTDVKYLSGLRGFRVWCYWYTTDIPTGKQWRLTDSASQSAWRKVAQS